MALIKCPECGKEVSDKSEKCIHCGCPIKKNTINNHSNLTLKKIGIGFVFILILVVSINGIYRKNARIDLKEYAVANTLKSVSDDENSMVVQQCNVYEFDSELEEVVDNVKGVLSEDSIIVFCKAGTKSVDGGMDSDYYTYLYDTNGKLKQYTSLSETAKSQKKDDLILLDFIELSANLGWYRWESLSDEKIDEIRSMDLNGKKIKKYDNNISNIDDEKDALLIEYIDYEIRSEKFDLAEMHAAKVSSDKNREQQYQKIFETYYNKGIELLQEQQYGKSAIWFEKCTGYADAKEKFKECNYNLGLEAYMIKEYELALDYLELAAGNEQADGLSNQILEEEKNYTLGIEKFNSKEYVEAVEYLTKCNDYMGANDKLGQSYYYLGTDLLEDGSYEEAKEYYKNAIPYYKQAEAALDKIETAELCYEMAEAALGNGEYEEAINNLNKCDWYADAKSKLMEAYYAEAQNQLTRNNYDKAMEYLVQCIEFEDAKDIYNQYYYEKAKEEYKKENYENALEYLDKTIDSEKAVKLKGKTNQKIKLREEYNKAVNNALNFKMKEAQGFFMKHTEYKDSAVYLEAVNNALESGWNGYWYADVENKFDHVVKNYLNITVGIDENKNLIYNTRTAKKLDEFSLSEYPYEWGLEWYIIGDNRIETKQNLTERMTLMGDQIHFIHAQEIVGDEIVRGLEYTFTRVKSIHR